MRSLPFGAKSTWSPTGACAWIWAQIFWCLEYMPSWLPFGLSQKNCSYLFLHFQVRQWWYVRRWGWGRDGWDMAGILETTIWCHSCTDLWYRFVPQVFLHYPARGQGPPGEGIPSVWRREDEDDVPLRSRNRNGLSPFVGTTACCHGHSVFTVSIDSFNEQIILSSSDLLILWFCQVTQALLMYHAAVPHQVDAATDGYTP